MTHVLSHFQRPDINYLIIPIWVPIKSSFMEKIFYHNYETFFEVN